MLVLRFFPPSLLREALFSHSFGLSLVIGGYSCPARVSRAKQFGFFPAFCINIWEVCSADDDKRCSVSCSAWILLAAPSSPGDRSPSAPVSRQGCAELFRMQMSLLWWNGLVTVACWSSHCIFCFVLFFPLF